ncbi:MAG TPA: hypothetical protein VGF25_23110 [Thermoleophilaceae bacterium]
MRHSRFGGRRSALLAAALATAAVCSTGAGTASAKGLPDAEIFATNNTSIITDQADSRLGKRLVRFDRQVRRIIGYHGGRARASQLLDGVFFSSALGTTTFERSREFDVDAVSRRELHDIAERVRRRFHQESVLTFDYPERRRDPVDAVQVEVPGISVQRLRDRLLVDAEARERLFGGSVTLDGRLILVAALEDVGLVKRVVKDIGGDFDRALIRLGKREFVG